MNRLPAWELAVRNFDWLVRKHGIDAVSLDWNKGTMLVGDFDGHSLFELTRPGFTPATAKHPPRAIWDF